MRCINNLKGSIKGRQIPSRRTTRTETSTATRATKLEQQAPKLKWPNPPAPRHSGLRSHGSRRRLPQPLFLTQRSGWAGDVAPKISTKQLRPRAIRVPAGALQAPYPPPCPSPARPARVPTSPRCAPAPAVQHIGVAWGWQRCRQPPCTWRNRTGDRGVGISAVLASGFLTDKPTQAPFHRPLEQAGQICIFRGTKATQRQAPCQIPSPCFKPYGRQHGLKLVTGLNAGDFCLR